MGEVRYEQRVVRQPDGSEVVIVSARNAAVEGHDFGLEPTRIVEGPAGGSMAGGSAEWLIADEVAALLDEERVRREELQRALGREMLAYSRWRDFSVSAREQWRRAKTGEYLAEVGPIGAALAPLAPLPYPRWPHGVL